MNGDALYEKLIAAARRHPPGQAAPYAFEKRVMACLTQTITVDYWSLWSAALWRAVAPCLGIMVLTSAWTFLASNYSARQEILTSELEQTVLAAIDTTGEEW